MSQQTVINFLKKNKDWFTAKQISQKLGISIGSCTKNIYGLMKSRLIQRREAAKRYCFEYKYGRDKNGI